MIFKDRRYKLENQGDFNARLRTCSVKEDNIKIRNINVQGSLININANYSASFKCYVKYEKSKSQ